MARIDLKFLDKDGCDITIKTLVNEELTDIIICTKSGSEELSIYLDKSTAIKFAKTLRTEINKIKEEVNNG